MSWNKIAVLDMDSIAYTIGHPKKIIGDNGKPMRSEDDMRFIYLDKNEEELKESANKTMDDILTKGGFDGYIAYIKGKNTTGNRLSVNPDYKANRKKETPLWWDFVKQYLIDKWGVFEVDDMEVDDAVNITRLCIANTHIVAVDKDLLNLEGTHYNWVKDEWNTMSKEQATYEFWKDMVTGQFGDNVKGIAGIGKMNEIFIKNLFVPTPEYVLALYIKKRGEIRGIKEFYSNYTALKILEKDLSFVIPATINFKKDVNTEKVNGW